MCNVYEQKGRMSFPHLVMPHPLSKLSRLSGTQSSSFSNWATLTVQIFQIFKMITTFSYIIAYLAYTTIRQYIKLNLFTNEMARCCFTNLMYYKVTIIYKDERVNQWNLTTVPATMVRIIATNRTTVATNLSLSNIFLIWEMGPLKKHVLQRKQKLSGNSS